MHIHILVHTVVVLNLIVCVHTLDWQIAGLWASLIIQPIRYLVTCWLWVAGHIASAHNEKSLRQFIIHIIILYYV